MAQYTYAMQPPIGVEGQLWGTAHESRPYELPQRAQITTFTLADGSPAAGEDWTIVATDVDTGQTFTLEFESGASVAATLAALTAAASVGQFRNLFSVVDDAATVATWAARNKGKVYSFVTTVGGGTGTNTAAVATTAIDYDAVGLPFGRAVVRGTGDMEMAEIGASSVCADIVGVLFRTDANAFHSFEADSLSDSDFCERASMQRVLCRGTFLALVEEAVTPASRVWIRRALTGGTGALGRFGDAPDAADGAELWTMTPTAAENQFVILVRVTLANGDVQSVPLDAGEPDGSTTATEICDGWRTAFAAAQADGLLAGLAAGGTTTLTLTAPVGIDFTVSNIGEGVVATVETTNAAPDKIDCSAIFAYESSAAASELAVVRVKGLV